MAILWVHKITHAGTAAAWLRLAAIAKTVSIFPSFTLINIKAFFTVFRLIPRSDFTHVGQVAEVATEYRIRASPLHHPPPARTAINSETALRGDRGRKSPLLLRTTFSRRLLLLCRVTSLPRPRRRACCYRRCWRRNQGDQLTDGRTDRRKLSARAGFRSKCSCWRRRRRQGRLRLRSHPVVRKRADHFTGEGRTDG